MEKSEEIKLLELAFFAAVLSLISAGIFTIISYKELLSVQSGKLIEPIPPILPENMNTVI